MNAHRYNMTEQYKKEFELSEPANNLYQQFCECYGRPTEEDQAADNLLRSSAYFLSLLSIGTIEEIKDCLHDDVSFQQLPLPIIKGKKTTAKTFGLMLRILTSWELIEI